MKDLIRTCIILPDIHIKAINSFSEEHSGEGILFLLDGFDELARDLQVNYNDDVCNVKNIYLS